MSVKLKKKLKEIMVTALLTAVIGEVYFYPFGTAFRFTAGVIAVSFLLLYFKEVPGMVLATFSGAFVFLFRVVLSFLVKGLSFEQAVGLHYPAFFYYLVYGTLLGLCRIRNLVKMPVNFVSVMSLSDVAANLVELSVRREMNFAYFQRIFPPLVGVGLIRSIVTYAFYWMMERQKLIILKEEHEKRYAELVEILSELKAELLFLKKSTADMEDVMKESYEIYSSISENMSGDEILMLKEKALDLARKVHDIKKDYLRINAGFSQLIPEENEGGMRISAILSLLRKNTERWMKEERKKVELITIGDEDFIVKNYFDIFSILGNLVYNALEAVNEEGGRIRVVVKREGEEIIILVEDNGCGIDSRDLPYIFEPGFSTKVMSDGSFSTGLGLTHVKNLVEKMGGKIEVESEKGIGSRFYVKLPVDSVVLRT
jgi:two-component system sensor histidine kinase YcbA